MVPRSIAAMETSEHTRRQGVAGLPGRGARFIAANVRGVFAYRTAGLELLFNAVITHIPSHTVRLWWLRGLGARIGPGSSIFRGTTVLSARKLRIGDNCNVGWRCMLDARGDITLGNAVVIASDVHLITGTHHIDQADFKDSYAPISINDFAWLASRATVLPGVVIGYGGVAAAGAVVADSVMPFQVVGGVPARPIARRTEELDYNPGWRARFH